MTLGIWNIGASHIEMGIDESWVLSKPSWSSPMLILWRGGGYVDRGLMLCEVEGGEDEEGIATVEGEANGGGGDEEGIEAVQL